MKRDYTIWLAGGILVVAVLLLAAPQKSNRKHHSNCRNQFERNKSDGDSQSNSFTQFNRSNQKSQGENITRIVDLSPTHNVLTGIAAGEDGTIYFTEFTPAP